MSLSNFYVQGYRPKPSSFGLRYSLPSVVFWSLLLLMWLRLMQELPFLNLSRPASAEALNGRTPRSAALNSNEKERQVLRR
jgi:hypothetical protein